MNLSQTLVSCLTACAISAPLMAQTDVLVVDGSKVGIVPAADGTPDRYDVHIVWTIQSNGTMAGANLTTGLMLFLNGNTEVPTASTVVPIQLDVTTGFCGFPTCGGGCGGGYIDGVFNTMLCINDPPTCDTCDCSCQFPWITTTLPNVELQPGDDIRIAAFPAPGATPLLAGDDFLFELEFDGPRFWNHRLRSVTPQPTSAPGTYDLLVEADFTSVGMNEQALVAYQLILVINGQAGLEYDLCQNDPWIISPDNVCNVVGACPDSEFCASSSCGGQNIAHHCEPFAAGEPGFPYPGCGCLSEPVFMTIPGVLVEPDDEVLVVLVPADGSLPTLPGFEEDNQADVSFNPADINADGFVNAADLALLLGNWTGSAGYQPCPPLELGDLNGDCRVDAADLAMLLGAWSQ